MRIPRTNFSTAALHDANQADDFDDPHPGASGSAYSQPADSPAHDHLFEAPVAPRRAAADAVVESYAGRAARLYGPGSAYAPAQVTASSNQPLPTLAEIVGHFGDETWESHFFLSPNVRFTRTPEREFMKRRAPIDESESLVEENKAEETATTANEHAAPHSVAETSLPDAAPTVEPEAASYSPSELLRVLTRQLPHWTSVQSRARDESNIEPTEASIEVPGNEVPSGVDLREIAPPALAPTEEPNSPAVAMLADVGPAAAGVPGRHLPYLSDHAFFEFMPLEIGNSPSAGATISAPKAPETTSQIVAVPRPAAPGRWKSANCRRRRSRRCSASLNAGALS